MTKIVIKVELKAPSVNEIYTGKFRNKKSSTYQKFKREFVKYLSLERELLKLKDIHANSEKRGIELNIYELVPSCHFFKKDGDISKNKRDCDSIRKAVQDCFCEFIGIEDKFVISCKNEQFPSDKKHWEFFIEFKLKKENKIPIFFKDFS